jgi:hypothetical protein
VEQSGFVITWFNEMFKRAESGDERAAAEARFALGWLLGRGCWEVEKLALGDGDGASKAWAGRALACIGALIEADDEKLCKANEAYKKERPESGKLLRNDLWFPRNPLYQALHRELVLCEVYRGETPWAKARRYLPEIEPSVVPTEYGPVLKLPPLSLKSFPRWEKEVWKLVRKHNPDLVSKLRQEADRKQVVAVHSDGVTRFLVKPLNLTWKLLRPQFRRHLRAIARCCG